MHWMKPDSGSSLSDSKKKEKGEGVGAALPLPRFPPFSCSRFLNFGDSTISEPWTV